MPRPTALVLAAVLLAPPLAAQSPELAADSDYKAGLSRMQDQVPDLAIISFEKARATFKDSAPDSQFLTLKIGETFVRAARNESDRAKATLQAETALKELSAEGLEINPGAIFWSGQAALILGRIAEAAEFFSRLKEAKDPALRNRSQLARAHLLASMGRHSEAHAVLTGLASTKDATITTEARLLQGSLLLAEGKLDRLADLFPADAEPADKVHLQQQRYLLARLAQARGEHAQAADLFRPLAENPERLSAAIQHGAIVGLAESLQATESGENQTEEAIDILINLIEKVPHTPLLEGALSRLLSWADTNETLKTRVEERLRAWANAPSPAAFKERQAEDPQKPAESKPVLPKAEADRAGYALYYYARYLAEKNDPNSNELAAKLLRDLRDDHQGHPLAPASLLETAWLQSAADHTEEAIATLKTLETSTPSPALKAEAIKLAAHLKFKQEDFKAAAEAFSRARSLLTPSQAEKAALNTGVSLLRAGDQTAFGDLLKTLDAAETRSSLQLEQALYLVSRREGDARPILDRFLRENPLHPRAPEAQLAYATELLRLEPGKPLVQEEARARLDEINPDQLVSDAAALRHLLAGLNLAHLTGKSDDWRKAIQHAEHFIENRESGDLAPSIRLKLAEAYYMNGNHRTARIEFEKLAEEQKEGLLHEVALFFAARAALKLGTEKSPAQARELLERVIAAKGVTASEARLLLARSQIAPSPSKALVTLKPLLADTADNTHHVQALLLAAEAHRALGEESDYRKAIEIYDLVLARKNLPYALSNRFHSLRGQACELLKDTEKALESYYHVVNRENLKKGEEPTEWYWYTECGFKLVQLLEQEKRWKSALRILQKLAESGSPRAKEARERFEKLQLERQIWELD